MLYTIITADTRNKNSNNSSDIKKGPMPKIMLIMPIRFIKNIIIIIKYFEFIIVK